MITIVNYGVGNIASLVAMFDHIGVEARLSGNADVIAGSSALVLPGVGQFAHAMKVLHENDLTIAIRAAVDRGSSLLGVCLGMQFLARHSEEGDVEGLGLIAANVKRIVPSRPHVKVPNMRWREVAFRRQSWIGSPGDPLARYYFAHSYHMICDNEENVIATVDLTEQKRSRWLMAVSTVCSFIQRRATDLACNCCRTSRNNRSKEYKVNLLRTVNDRQ